MENVADIYPLTPMQEGMLFHGLLSPETGLYHEIMACTLTGAINREALTEAWRWVVRRHPVLRTIFLWEGLDKPMQVVRKSADLHLEELDWQDQDPNQAETDFIEADRRRGFNLNKAPLMRITLAQVEPSSYRFFWSHHHLLLCGWSLGLVLRDVFLRYSELCGGEPYNPPAPKAFRDYVAELRKQDKNKAEVYWREQFANFAGSGEPQLQAGDGEGYKDLEFHLDSELSTRLGQQARGQRVTLNHMVQAAWSLSLSRFTNSRDIVFGTVISGRPPAMTGVLEMVGLFINSVPVRAQIAGNRESFLQDLAARGRRAESNGLHPLTDINKWCGHQGGGEFFQSLVIFENYPMDDAVSRDFGGMKVSNVKSFERTNYPLVLVAEPGRQLKFKLTYDQSVYSHSGILRLQHQLLHVLEGLAADQNLETLLRLAPELEQESLTLGKAATGTQDDRLLITRLQKQAEENGDAPALIQGEQHVNFSDFQKRALAIAGRLLQAGLRHGQTVAILYPRGIQAAVAMSAVLQAGGCYLPLDPEQPQARLEFMLEDSGAAFIIGSPETSSAFAGDQRPLINEDPDTYIDDIQLPEITESDPAYIIYTSGSTGRPKGVRMSRRGLRHYLNQAGRHYGITDLDGAAAVTNLAFDATVTSLWLPLAFGKSVLFLDGPVDQLPMLLRQNAGRRLLKLTPAHLDILATEPDRETWLSNAPVWVVGGEVLSGRACRPFLDADKAPRIFNEYGPTEAAVGSTIYEVGAEDGDGPLPIGKPLADMDHYLLDNEGRIAPVGVEGELHLAGPGLADGYHGREDATQAVFIPNPFSDQDGARMYRTGDLAAWDEHGLLHFHGRRDGQVKIRGYRIETGEIAAVLEQHTRVRRAHVLVKQRGEADLILAAYYQSHDGQTLDPQSLQQHLGQHLPDYMLPERFAQVQDWPLTANGKLDLNALPELQQAQTRNHAYEPPVGDIEHQLAEAWCKVLGLEKVGRFDNFFELGGHSLTATRVVSHMRRHNRDLALAQIFATPRLVDLAESLSGADMQTPLPTMKKAARRPRRPQSAATGNQSR